MKSVITYGVFDLFCEGYALCLKPTEAEGDMFISGTKGCIYVEAPWWKTHRFEIRREDLSYRRHFTDVFEGDGLCDEIADYFYRIQGHRGREIRLLRRSPPGWPV